MTVPLVVVGASAGGIEALHRFLPTLPPGLEAALAVVVHRGAAEEDERLARVLAIDALLPVEKAQDGEEFKAGRIYVAPAGCHLQVHGGRFVLTAAATENTFRPSVDALFRTAAESLGPSVAAVVLSGLLDDGTAGLGAVKARGGLTIVQDPADASFADMPRNALAAVEPDYILSADAIAPVLAAFAAARPRDGRHEMKPVEQDLGPSTFSCPACGGVLHEVETGKVLGFRCRTGHAYSPMTLFAMQEDGFENALWVAMRTLEERAELSDRLARRSEERGLDPAARRFRRQAQTARDRVAVVRDALGNWRQALTVAEDAVAPLTGTAGETAG